MPRVYTSGPTWLLSAKLKAERRKFTIEELKSVLHYDPETGHFTWLTGRRCKVNGGRAGILKEGYIRIKFGGTNYYSHRVAWFYVTGEWPKGILDHKNRDGTDNSFSNLREATASQNAGNSAVRKNNKLGVKGIVRRSDGKFEAKIRKNYKAVCIGRFDTLAEASAAYAREAKKCFGEFASDGVN